MNDPLHSLPPGRLQLLHMLIEEVLRVNQQFNLTSVREPEAAWNKHILDSLQGLESGLFEDARRVIDLGSGAGFPGLPIAVARPQLHVTLLEATQKKCHFLRDTIEQFGLNASVLCERAEVAGQNRAHRQKYDVATARAVGSLPEVLELCLPLVRVGGGVLLWRGEKAPQEVQDAKSALQLLGGAFVNIREYSLPDHALRFHLVQIEKRRPIARIYPRRVGLPKNQPLSKR